MATVSTYLKMMDQFSSPLQRVINKTNTAITSMERLRRLVETPANTNIKVNVDTSGAIAQMQHVRSTLATSGSAAVIDVSINASDIMSRISAVRSSITSALSSAAVEVTISGASAISAAHTLKSRITAALAGIDIRPEITMDTGGLRSQLLSELGSIPATDIKVKLDTGDALSQATLLRTQILSRIGTIIAQVELHVNAQLIGSVGALDTTMDKLRLAVDRLTAAIHAGGPGGGPGGGGGGGSGAGGKGLMRVVGGAIVGIVTAIGAASVARAGMGLAIEQQQLHGSIQAQTGATGPEAAGLVQGASNVYASGWGESLTTIGADMAKVRQNLDGLSNEAAEAFLKSSYVVEKVSNGATQVAEVSKITKTLMQNFEGLGETDALDMITTGFQRGGDFAGDFMDTINEYSVHFVGLGMSAEQMFATLLAGSEAGAFNLDKVGDSVKESFIRMQDLSKGSQDAFKAMGLDGEEMAAKIAAGGDSANQAFQATLMSLGNMDDALVRNQIGVALFGTQWEDMEDKVILAMTEGQKGLGEFQGATERAGSALEQNLGFQAEKLKRNFLLKFAEAGKGAVDALMPIVTKLNAAFEAGKFDGFFSALRIGLTVVTMFLSGFVNAALWLVDVINNNWPLIISILGGIGAAITALVLPKLWAMIPALWAAVPPLYAQAVAWLAIHWPILLIGAAVAALIFILYSAGVTFRDVIGFAAGLFMYLYGVVHNQVAYIWNILVSLAEFIANLFVDPIYAVKKLFYDLAQEWGKQVVNMLRSAEDFAGGFMTTILGAINGVLKGFNWLSKKLNDMIGVDLGEAKLFDEQNVHAVSDEVQKMLDNMKAPTSDEDVFDFSSAKMDLKNLNDQWNIGQNAGFGAYDRIAGSLGKIGDKFSPPELPAADPFSGSGQGNDGIDHIGKVGEVGKINDTVEISSEDLKTMRELAEMKNIQNFVTLTPQFTFGDTNVRQDGRSVDEIVANIAERMEQEIASTARGVFA